MFSKGVNLTLFTAYICIAWSRRKSRPVNRMILFCAILMFLLSTAFIAVGFYRLILGFVYLRDEPGGPTAYFSDYSIPVNYVSTLIYTALSIVGDTVLVSFFQHFTLIIIPS